MRLHKRAQISLWLILGLASCDAATPPLQVPQVVSEGAERKSVVQTFAMAAGVAEAEVWLGPTEELRADLLSLTIMVRGRADQRLAIGLEDGAGRVLIDPASPEFSPNRALSGWEIAVAQVPVTIDALPLIPPYKVKVKRSEGGTPAESFTLQVWTKRALVPGSVPLAQELPVQVIHAGGEVEATQLARALESARNIWRLGGIEITESPRTALDASLQEEVGHVVINPSLGSDSPSLTKLLRLSSSLMQHGLPLFLVQDIALVDGNVRQGSLWAISGGIPVPPLENTPHSGLAISAELLKQDPHYAGQIIAHEVGHALGLFHSTEAPLIASAGQSAVPIHDGLADTLACPAHADRNGDRILSAGECGQFDAHNLMFWGTARGAISLSASQADIARRSILSR